MTNKQFPSYKYKAFLAPMSGVTDVAFRTLCKRYGAGITYTEFVNSTGLVRGNISSQKLVKKDALEKPVAVQLFGNNIADIISAGTALENEFDIIDVNCGCPAWKVIKTGAGSQMLKDPSKIKEFIAQLVMHIKKPVTIKIRTGIDEQTINAVTVAKIAQSAGASAITIHGRTQKQGYAGVANWDIIKQVKDSVSIPVFGNGDIKTPEDAKKRLEETGVDAVMIGRAAIGNPYLFTQINDYLEKGTYDSYSKYKQFEEYCELAKKHEIDFSKIKQQALYFSKGVLNGSVLRQKLVTCQSIEELCETFKEYD